MAKASTRSNSVAKIPDAIALLKADHKEVYELFKKFESARTEASKRKLVERICSELKVHAQVEEEIFYPAVREAIEDADLMDEASVEHATAKDLIAQLEKGELGEELYKAKVMVLGEYIRHHVKEEEKEMFPQVKKADLDLKELGTAIKERKTELLHELS
jgi:hemerythrin superfamily protein